MAIETRAQSLSMVLFHFYHLYHVFLYGCKGEAIYFEITPYSLPYSQLS